MIIKKLTKNILKAYFILYECHAETFVPKISLWGPLSTAFQFHDRLDGHNVNPSWCLLVRTTYLKYHNTVVQLHHWSPKCNLLIIYMYYLFAKLQVVNYVTQRFIKPFLLCTRFCKQICPMVWIIKFCCKLWSKVTVLPVWRICVLYILYGWFVSSWTKTPIYYWILKHK